MGRQPLERKANRCGVRVRGLRRRFDCASSDVSSFLARARIGILSIGKPEPASQAGAARRRRPTAATAAEKVAARERMKERMDSRPPKAARRGGGRMFGAREAAIRSNPPPSVRRVQRGRPPTAAQTEAEAQHAASVRAQAPRPSGAPCRARRSGGRGGRSSATPPAVAGGHAPTFADTERPATAEWRSLRLTGRAEGLAGRLPS